MLKKQHIEKIKSLTIDQTFVYRIAKVKKYLFKAGQVFLLALFLSITASLVFDTPEEYTLKLENAKYNKNLKLIKSELASLNSTLSEIQEKDDNIYRMVLGVEPVAYEIRMAGIGGASEEGTTNGVPNDMTLSSYQKELNQLNAKLNVQSVSFDELTSLATNNINRIKHRPSIFPVAPDDLIRFSSGYGYRTHPIFNIRKFHKGIDLTALKGSPVYSTAKGKVIIAANLNDGYGNKVVIDHGFGYKTVYAHLHKILVKVGQEKNLGDLIGQVGNTGISVAPHLHYEVRLEDDVINPLNFIFKDISSEEYQLITKR